MDEPPPSGSSISIREIGQIASLLAAILVNNIPPTRQILTGEEAVLYCKLASYRAFSAWRRRFHVPACGHCRFALVKLDMGLERESRLVRARF